jgi:AraC-like DNA-binding protein
MFNPFARAIIHHKLYHEEICAKLGFSSTAYFRKVFQSVYHTSPSQMRKKENMI